MNLERNSAGKTIVGTLLILLGVALFLSNFEIIHGIRRIVFSWQIILMVVGIILLANHKDSGIGLVLLMVGGIGLIAKLNHTSMRFIFREYWPALLIIFGIYILFNKSALHLSNNKSNCLNNEPSIEPDKF